MPEAAAPAVVAPVAAETKPAETPAADVKPAQGEDAARFAALAKKERALVAREREIKRIASESEGKFAQQEAELQKLRTETKRLSDLRTRVKTDPLKALEEELGLSYDAITEAKLNGGKPTGPWAATRDLREEMNNLKQSSEERFTKMQQESTQAREREQQEAMQEFRSDCEAFVDGNADSFPLISALGAKGLVAQQIEYEYSQSGKRLSYQAAAEAVEKQLDENIEKGQQARAKKLAAKTPAETPEPGKQTQAAQQRTLSNDLTPSTTGRQILSEAERVRRAVAALG